MNRLIALLALALLTTTANARELVYLPNKAGGEIILTDSKSTHCPTSTRVAISRTREGDTLAGCWAISLPYVYVKWEDGELSMFKLADFLAFRKEVGA